MVPPNLNSWSIPRKESLDPHQKHALRNRRFLRTLLYSDQKFNSGYNRKKPLRIKKYFLDKSCFVYEQLLRPVQRTACTICQCSSIDEIVLSGTTEFLLISGQFHSLWGANCFGKNPRQKWACLSILKFIHTFLLPFCNANFRQKFLLWIQSGSCCILSNGQCKFSGRSFCSGKYNKIRPRFLF